MVNKPVPREISEKIVNMIVSSTVVGLPPEDQKFLILEESGVSMPVSEIEDIIKDKNELILYKLRQSKLERVVSKDDTIQNLNQTIQMTQNLIKKINLEDLSEPTVVRNLIGAIGQMNQLMRTSLTEANIQDDKEEKKSDSIRISELKDYVQNNLKFFKQMIGEAEAISVKVIEDDKK